MKGLGLEKYQSTRADLKKTISISHDLCHACEYYDDSLDKMKI